MMSLIKRKLPHKGRFNGSMILLTLLVIMAFNLPLAEATEGPIAEYHFDGNAQDSSGYGNHGTIFGNPTFVQGIDGQAMSFDGVDDYIQTSLTSNNLPLTIETWFYSNVNTGEHSIVDSDVSGTYGQSIILGYWDGDDTLDVQYHNGFYDSTYVVQPGVWYHAVVVFSTGRVDLYVNGNLIGSKTHSQSSLDGSNFRIGRHNVGDPQWFNGMIDEVRIYDRALNADEISQQYNTVVANGDFEGPIDTTPPLTTITLAGTEGLDGWYTSDVEVTLTATDDDSCVCSTEYSFDDINWATYTTPFTVSTEGTTTVYYHSTDNSGNVETIRNVVIKVDTTAPVIAAHEDVTVEATSASGALVSYTSPATSDAVDGTATCAPASGSTFTIGDTTVQCDATDAAGNPAIQTSFTVHVVDTTDPTISISSPSNDALINTNIIAVEGSATDGGSGLDKVEVKVDSDTFATATVTGASWTFTTSMLQDGLHAITAKATDNAGNTEETAISITIDTVSPITSNVIADPSPAAVNTVISLSATVSDATTGGSIISSAEFSIDNAGFSAMIVNDGAFDEVSEDVTANLESFATPGVHNVCVRATDAAGNIGYQECTFLPIYDPNGGFVTGGGWINSPPGAYVADPTLTGKANFGFVSKYKKGANIPTGETEFQFKAGDLNFHSTVYEWLVVSGAKAQYKGSGTINGAGNYGFLLTATDSQINGGGDVDKFRIKIVNKDADGTVVYDNKFGESDDIDADPQAIGGGNIVIHKEK